MHVTHSGLPLIASLGTKLSPSTMYLRNVVLIPLSRDSSSIYLLTVRTHNVFNIPRHSLVHLPKEL
ncbi:hypothetical protein WH47_02811 [Habropoda laboriosa]|uniref:Uncharacterized protein n=1 Tax=Habropoda laboriosa TaxID=597456 RepID=A0A0L7RHN7_9HYME|nr:hypothetical protein WH47_02811 [Habropoda laboriosa]